VTTSRFIFSAGGLAGLRDAPMVVTAYVKQIVQGDIMINSVSEQIRASRCTIWQAPIHAMRISPVCTLSRCSTVATCGDATYADPTPWRPFGRLGSALTSLLVAPWLIRAILDSSH
jgi:hypothetical protein